MVIAGERGGNRAAVGAGDLDRLGLDHQVADRKNEAIADQGTAAAALIAEGRGAARVRLDLRLHRDHGRERVLGPVLRESSKPSRYDNDREGEGMHEIPP